MLPSCRASSTLSWSDASALLSGTAARIAKTIFETKVFARIKSDQNRYSSAHQSTKMRHKCDEQVRVISAYATAAHRPGIATLLLFQFNFDE